MNIIIDIPSQCNRCSICKYKNIYTKETYLEDILETIESHKNNLYNIVIRTKSLYSILSLVLRFKIELSTIIYDCKPLIISTFEQINNKKSSITYTFSSNIYPYLTSPNSKLPKYGAYPLIFVRDTYSYNKLAGKINALITKECCAINPAKDDIELKWNGKSRTALDTSKFLEANSSTKYFLHPSELKTLSLSNRLKCIPFSKYMSLKEIPKIINLCNFSNSDILHVFNYFPYITIIRDETYTIPKITNYIKEQ